MRRTPPAQALQLPRGKRLIVLGDLHLSAHAPQDWQPLFALLNSLSPEDTAGLVCLGDLFEYYLGPAHLRGPLGEVARRLEQLVQRGVPVWLVPGNRDFLIGAEFRRRGMFVYPHGLRLDLQLESVDAGATCASLWIVHGDELSHGDLLHLAWSRLSRAAPSRFVARFMPTRLLDACARTLRAHSRRRRQRRQSRANAQPREFSRVPQDLAEALLAELARTSSCQACWLITGHFHAPLAERAAAGTGTLFTVGEWDRLGGVVASFKRSCANQEPGAQCVIRATLLHTREVAT